MKPVLIIENATSSLVNENVGADKYTMSGIFTEFGVKNRNERIYNADRFMPVLEELNSRISQGVVFGEFDHPDVFETALQRSSHMVTKAKYVAEKNAVLGEIRLLTTSLGKEARALVDDGCPLFVSSRAAGVTESDGTVTLKKLFTYDLVAEPGFASAKMSSGVLNESLGFNTDTSSNLRIVDMSESHKLIDVTNDSQINDLFNMNKNDLVTKNLFNDYSQYLISEIAKTNASIMDAVRKNNLDPKRLEELIEYYENLNNQSAKMIKYMDYLAGKIEYVISENTSIKNTTNKLIEHNDYLAENLEKAIKYSEYIAENLDKNIEYSEYLAENLDKNIEYSEYIAENLDKSIAYGEYIAENLDKTIAYGEYIAENLDKTIEYSEYIAENLESNIAYSEYIAEHLDDNIAYGEYLAENVDKVISYAGLITEKLNGNKLNESAEEQFPTLQSAGFETVEDWDNEEEECTMSNEDEMEEAGSEEEMLPEAPNYMEEEQEDFEKEEGEDCDTCDEEEFDGSSDDDLSESIDRLIEEAKKRKVLESNDNNFMSFLNKSQIEAFYQLSVEEQDAVRLHINENKGKYFSTKDVVALISEAIASKTETLEERVIRLMPENTKTIWSELSESAKRSFISQAKLYASELVTESQIANFWETRDFKTKTTRVLISEEKLISEDKLSQDDMNAILERMKNL